MKKRELTPKLRFPEFCKAGKWRVSRLIDVANFVKDRVPLNQISLDSYISTENMIPNFEGVTLAPKLPPQGTAIAFQKGDVLASNIRPYLRKIWLSDRTGGASNDVLVIRKKSDLSERFLESLLANDAFLEYVMDGAKGVKMPRGDISKIQNYLIAFPIEAEQRKISDFLGAIDAQIVAHVQKLNLIRGYKKGLMQQLFPAEGETVPKLRFPGFRRAGKWRERKIGELLLEKERPLNMQDGTEYSLVTVKRRYGGVVFRERLEGKSIKVKSQFLVCRDDFLISKRQIVHNACGIVPEELAGSIVSNEYAVFLPREDCDIQFFNYFAQQPVVSRSFLASSVGIVIEKMLFKTDVWLRQRFCFPSLEEQEKIAAVLTSLDALITHHTQKLALLKAHKKGLMQQLFPSPEEIAR